MTKRDKLDPEQEEKMRLERVAELQKIASALLDDPETSAAFKRVGISGDFTMEEYEAIYVRFGLGNYFAKENIIRALDYQAVIQALARRVADGIYQSVYDEEAQRYAFSNTFVEGNYERISEQRVDFDNFLMVLREFMAWDQLPTYIEKIQNWKFDPRHKEYDHDEQLVERHRPLERKSREIFHKYGLIGRFDVSRVAMSLVKEGKTFDDVDAVRHHAMLGIGITLVKEE